MTLTIRAATNLDGDGIAAVISEIFEEYDGCIFDRDGEFPELAAIASHFSQREGALWVVDSAGGVGGCLGILPDGRNMELHKVYLRRDFRGTGMASRLLQLGVDFAVHRRARKIRLWTDSRFAAGHRFYQKHKFVRTQRTRQLDDLSRSFEFEFVLDLDKATSM